MYRIIVVSDTHRHLEYVLGFLQNIREFDMIIHLGDNTSDADTLKKIYPEKQVIAVKGNTDISSYESEIFCNIEGVNFFVTHGHIYGVKMGTERLWYRARELGADVVLYGHTHIPVCENEDGVLMLNPGGHNSLNRGVGIIEIEEEEAKGCLYPC